MFYALISSCWFFLLQVIVCVAVDYQSESQAARLLRRHASFVRSPGTY
jgi:hypothetical protein